MVKRNSPTGLGHLSSQVHMAESSWLWEWSNSLGVWGISGPRDSSASGSSAGVWRLTHLYWPLKFCHGPWEALSGLWTLPLYFWFCFLTCLWGQFHCLVCHSFLFWLPILLPDCTLNFSPPQSSRVAECQSRVFSQRCPKHARCVWWSSGCHGMRGKT